MLRTAKTAGLVSMATVLVWTMLLLPTQSAFAQDLVTEGKKIAEDRKKGNCVSCHVYEGADMPGNAGPPLVAMKQRFPDKQKLFDQIWDATTKNPGTMMPPFGKHEILSKKDIEAITEWVWTL